MALNKITDESLWSGTSTSDPTYNWYYSILYNNAKEASVTEFYATVKMKFYVKFYDRLETV